MTISELQITLLILSCLAKPCINIIIIFLIFFKFYFIFKPQTLILDY